MAYCNDLSLGFLTFLCSTLATPLRRVPYIKFPLPQVPGAGSVFPTGPCLRRVISVIFSNTLKIPSCSFHWRQDLWISTSYPALYLPDLALQGCQGTFPLRSTCVHSFQGVLVSRPEGPWVFSLPVNCFSRLFTLLKTCCWC